MPLTNETTAQVSRPISNARHFRVFAELLIWNNAWKEFCQLQNLDADALADMGLTEASRASVTISQIAARMRG